MAVCSVCGNTIRKENECPACLLRLGVGSREKPQDNWEDLASLRSQFPNLEIKRLIGRGGMGAIFQARQTTLDRDVALKVIAKEISDDPTFLERFEREAKALAKLSHPNIVAIFDYGRTSTGLAYLMMEYVDGVNLREAMATKSVGADDALDLVATICRALDYAHGKGVVHRDIKPENILLGEDGALKVADFGIAKIVDESNRNPTLTATRQVLGSFHYLAPEQLESPDKADHRVDLYALGVVFYELLTGQLPLGRFESPSTMVRVDRRFDSIVLKTLQRRPDLRYQTAAQLESDLIHLRATAGQGVPVLQPLEAIHAVAQTSHSFPFECESYGGFARTSGVVQANPQGIRVEYRTRDALLGCFVSSDVSVVEIPVQRLSRCDFRPGVFSSKLILQSSSMTDVRDFPTADAGCIRLKIKRTDNALARRVLESAGFPADILGKQKFLANDVPKHPWIAMMFVVIAIINTALFVVSIMMLAMNDSGQFTPIGIVLICLILAPLGIVIPWLAAILHATVGAPKFTQAAAIVALFPISPVVILSAPFALWTLYWLRENDPENRSVASAKSWGTTTLFYLRETRQGRWVAAANAALLAILSLGLGIWMFGYYPSEYRYRVVDQNWESQLLLDSVQSRLFDLPGIYCESTRRGLSVRGWKYQMKKIRERMAIKNSPQIVWLLDENSATLSDKEISTSGSSYPVASFVSTEHLRTIQKGLGAEVASPSKPFTLNADMVREVKNNGGLTVTLSDKGRTQFEASAGATSTLGLIVNGQVCGIASRDSIHDSQITFKWDAYAFDGVTVQHAIRGPQIPYELELVTE